MLEKIYIPITNMFLYYNIKLNMHGIIHKKYFKFNDLLSVVINHQSSIINQKNMDIFNTQFIDYMKNSP